MKTIKTKEVIEKDIKVLDKTANLAKKIKNPVLNLKEKGENVYVDDSQISYGEEKIKQS